MRYKDIYVIWTVYFNSKLSKNLGRRVSINEAIPKPTLNELKNACTRLGFEIVNIKRARYPRVWWMDAGYVMIKRGDLGKREILRLIAKELRKIRGGR